MGNTPGVTKAVQEVHLDKQVTLLDSPGVVFAHAGAQGTAVAALRNAVKAEQLEDPTLPVGGGLVVCGGGGGWGGAVLVTGCAWRRWVWR